MEDSRKGKTDGEKELSTPNPHVDGGKGERGIVYNTKEGKNGRGERKKELRTKKKRNEKNIREEKEKTIRMVYSQVIALEHVRGYFLYRYMCITLSL